MAGFADPGVTGTDLDGDTPYLLSAFVAGVLFRQCPTVSRDELHRLETVIVSLLAPIFFGFYNMMGKASAIAGPMLVGLTAAVTGSGESGRGRSERRGGFDYFATPSIVLTTG